MDRYLSPEILSFGKTVRALDISSTNVLFVQFNAAPVKATGDIGNQVSNSYYCILPESFFTVDFSGQWVCKPISLLEPGDDNRMGVLLNEITEVTTNTYKIVDVTPNHVRHFELDISLGELSQIKTTPNKMNHDSKLAGSQSFKILSLDSFTTNGVSGLAYNENEPKGVTHPYFCSFGKGFIF